jgi:hypothetical protein
VVESWKEQYSYFEKERTDWEVTADELKQIGCSDEQGPIAIRYAKGRPKSNKRFKSVIEQKRK